MSVDTYIEEVIAKGDEGSAFLRRMTAPTLRNNEFIDVTQGMPVVRLKRGEFGYVHTATGVDSTDPVEHAASVVDRLVEQARAIGATPVALADVIDSASGDERLLRQISEALVERANEHGIAILNGENAILGDRIPKKVNVIGTMVSTKKPQFTEELGIINVSNTNYIVFNPEDMAVAMNSDGIGTKPELYERSGQLELGLQDSFAMKSDDTVKFGGRIVGMQDVVELRAGMDKERFLQKARELSAKHGFPYTLEFAEGDRIRSYAETLPAFNASGSSVSIVNEEFLRNPPKPSAGEWLIAIRDPNKNGRSNGFSGHRNTLSSKYGTNWHETERGSALLSYLAQPSTVFYSLFTKMLDEGLASSVYHMSGGSHKSKLNDPIAEHELFVQVKVFEPPQEEEELRRLSQTNLQNAYQKWPMGNHGYITTSRPNDALIMIYSHGLEAKVAGQLEKATSIKGVELHIPIESGTCHITF